MTKPSNRRTRCCSRVCTFPGAREVALQLLPECGRVFSGYDLSDGFEFTPDFDRLCGELAGVISIWLEENGI